MARMSSTYLTIYLTFSKTSEFYLLRKNFNSFTDKYKSAINGEALPPIGIPHFCLKIIFEKFIYPLSKTSFTASLTSDSEKKRYYLFFNCVLE